jgi:uncharacterized protein YbjT (DUF2867 family)
VILLTGGSGFLGRHLLRRLLAGGEAVRCLGRPGSPGTGWLREQPVEVALGHLLDPDALARSCRGVRQIVHLAAPVREVRDAAVEAFHAQGTRHLIEAARAGRVERFVMVSPLGAAPSAGLPFLRSRGAAEQQVRDSGLPHVLLQSSLIFGAGDRLLEGLIRILRRTGLVVLPGTGRTLLQPIWVGDVVSCLLHALSDDACVDRTIPIGGPQHLSYEEIADQVGKMMNLPRVKLHLSGRALGWTVRVLETFGQHLFLGYRHLELLDVGTVTAPDAVTRSFGFHPMPLIEGIAYQLTTASVPGAVRPHGAERGSKSPPRR